MGLRQCSIRDSKVSLSHKYVIVFKDGIDTEQMKLHKEWVETEYKLMITNEDSAMSSIWKKMIKYGDDAYGRLL